MAAPTVRPKMYSPVSDEANHCWFFNAGFNYHARILSSGSDPYKWVNSTADTNLWYLVKRSDDSDPFVQMGAANQNNVRVMLAPVFTATDATNFIPVADRSKAGVGSTPVAIVTEGTLLEEGIYRLTADMTRTAGDVTVSVVSPEVGEISSQTLSADGAFAVTVLVGPDTSVTVNLSAATGTASFTNIAFAEVSNSWDSEAVLRQASSGVGVKPWSSFYGDLDTLGFDTVYVRMSRAETPPATNLDVIWDESDMGTGRNHRGHAEWWIKDTSTGLATWEASRRYYKDPRLKGTDEEDTLFDRAGRDPADGVGSNEQGRTKAWVFSAGTWEIGLRLWNDEGDYTDYSFSTITVAADSRPLRTVLHSGGATYTTLAAAIAGETAARIQLLDGHDETQVGRFTPKTNQFIFCADGDTAIIRGRTDQSGNTGNDFSITATNVGLENFTMLPTGNTGNPQKNMIGLTATTGAVSNSFFVNLKMTGTGNNHYNDTFFVSQGSRTEPLHVLAQGIVSPRNEEYFMSSQLATTKSSSIHFKACEWNLSDTESGIRTTDGFFCITFDSCYGKNENKDTMRLFQTVGVDVMQCFLDGSTRLGDDISGTTCRVTASTWYNGNRYGRTNDSSNLPGFGSTLLNRECQYTNMAFTVPNGLSNTTVRTGTGAGIVAGINYLNSPYRGHASCRDNQAAHYTVKIDASNDVTVVESPGLSTTLTAYDGDNKTGGIVPSVQDGSTYPRTGQNAYGETGNGRVGLLDVDDYGLDQYFVPTSVPTTGDNLPFTPYDMWGTRRTNQTLVGAAIATPPWLVVPVVVADSRSRDRSRIR